MFEKPNEYDFRVPTQNAELWSIRIADEIVPYAWDNRKPTAQMLGRWQPWHEGHQSLFEEIVKKTGQVNIQVRDVKGVGDNPFDFETVKNNIEQALISYKNRIKHLEEMHKVLNKQIDDMERNHPHVATDNLTSLKKQKLQLKDEISRLNKLQWELDHETVHDNE